MKRLLILLVWLCLLVFIVSACVSTQEDGGTPGKNTMEVEPVEAVTIGPNETSDEVPAATMLPTTDVRSTSTPTVPEPAVSTDVQQVKASLEATDPNSVSLASGQVQLVEFFAFW
jgi:hypothetical protein